MKAQNPAELNVTLDLQIAVPELNIPGQKVMEEWVQTALCCSGYTPKNGLETELTIRVVDQDESRQLNNDYRQKNKPTNVLSFGFEAIPDVPIDLLGDLVICAPVVEQEAAQQAKETMAHWAHMVVHGSLHLLGYDHINSADAEQMENLEIQILNRLGFANPYIIDEKRSMPDDHER